MLRHTHPTAAGIEDALAVAWDMNREFEMFYAFYKSRTTRMIDILQKVREGPHAYDPDQPAGPRLIINRRLP